MYSNTLDLACYNNPLLYQKNCYVTRKYGGMLNMWIINVVVYRKVHLSCL